MRVRKRETEKKGGGERRKKRIDALSTNLKPPALLFLDIPYQHRRRCPSRYAAEVEIYGPSFYPEHIASALSIAASNPTPTHV